MQFVPVNWHGHVVNINRAVLKGGRWQRIFAVIDPKISQTREVRTLVGITKSTSDTFGQTITTEIEAKFGEIFSSKISYESTFSSTNS
jgi:hypothetical protein